MGFFSILYLIAFSVVGLSSLVNGDLFSYKSERDLRQDIFSDYDKLVRPVKRASTAVPAKITIRPLGLRSMNEKDQILILETLMFLSWGDEYLRWDPNEYDGITELHISPSEIWKPDIALYTAVGDSSFFPIVQTNAILYDNGTVLWVPPFTLYSRCPIPMRNYVSVSKTFVECTITMGSWTNSEKLLDIQLYADEVDVSDFQDYNHKWKLEKIVANRESKIYPCCEEAYSLVTFNVTLKRKDDDLNDNSTI